ncbi:unnamed protein product [Mucor hiemalis]
MYKSKPYGYDLQPDMSWAIARQDEALEDLIKSTRRVIRKHSDYMADARYPEQPQYYQQRPNYGDKRRPSCSHYHNNRVHPPPPPPPPPQYHKSHHPSYNDYIEPRKYYKPPSSPPSSRGYYNKSPEDSFSRTRKWINRLKPSNYYHSSLHTHPKHREPQRHCEDRGTDDEVGLYELRNKMRRSSSNNLSKYSTSSDSRPMIIPASIKSSPEKIIVIDVPLDVTVILRSVDQKKASVYRVTDLNLVEEILGGSKIRNHNSSSIEPSSETKKPSYRAKAEKNNAKPTKIRTSATMPNISLEPNTASTMVSSKVATPTKKKSGLTKYFSSLSISKLSDEPFNYLDSDDSTVEEVDARTNVIPMQNLGTPSLSEEEYEAEEETYIRGREQHTQRFSPRTRSKKEWMI